MILPADNETEVSIQTCCLTLSHCTVTRPADRCYDPTTPELHQHILLQYHYLKKQLGLNPAFRTRGTHAPPVQSITQKIYLCLTNKAQKQPANKQTKNPNPQTNKKPKPTNKQKTQTHKQAKEETKSLSRQNLRPVSIKIFFSSGNLLLSMNAPKRCNETRNKGGKSINKLSSTSFAWCTTRASEFTGHL